MRTLFNGIGISRGITWFSAGLAIGMLVLAVRSFWRYDEVGYYTWQSNPQPHGRDCRRVVASYRGALFFVGLESDLPPDGPFPGNQAIDWYGGERTEVIVNSGTWGGIPDNAVSMSFQTFGRWVPFSFNLAGGVRAIANPYEFFWPVVPNRQWKWRGAVVPDWFVFLVFAWKPGLGLRSRWMRRRRRRQGSCLACGYDLRAGGSGTCPECGSTASDQALVTGCRRSPKWRWAAVSGIVLVCGIAGICWALHDSDRAENVVRLEPRMTMTPVHAPARIELDVAAGVIVRFSFIPSGTFLMGSPPNEVERDANEAQHQVTVSSPFYMSTTTVTQEQYAAVMGDNPSEFKGTKLPVERVTWEEADEFCRRLSARTGRNICLPTEAQWEYACRAGTTTPFNTGRTLSRDQANYAMTTYPSNRRIAYEHRTVAVASFKPNAWGLYDMHGNVWQWCSDRYGEYPAGDVIDPMGADHGESRVLRGGSWGRSPELCRAAYRAWFVPDRRYRNHGFRLCLDF